MLPYLTFSVFAYAFINFALKIDVLASVLKGGGYSATSIKEAIFQIITYNGHTDNHLWFVFSLFIVFLINILLPKLMKSKTMLILLLMLYVSKAYVHYYGILDYTASDLLFFSLARVMCDKNRRITLCSPLSIAAVIAVFITSNCIYSYFYVTGMPGGILRLVLYITRSIASVSGISLVCTLSEYISSKPISGLLKETGMYSYDIYLMHAPFLVSGSMGILLSYSPFPVPLCCAAVLVIGLLLPYAVSRFIIRKIPPLSMVVLGSKK